MKRPNTQTARSIGPLSLRPLPFDADLRALWRQHGGSFHGPIVETGTMPERKLLPFLRRLIQRGVQ